MERNTRIYLGDSVYAEYEKGMIKLTTNNGEGPTNTIWLEPEVCSNFMMFAAEMNLRRKLKVTRNLIEDEI